MKLSNNNLNNDQPKSLSKRNDKKSVNLKWNSKLMFQLGLITCLLLVSLIMETKFKIIEKDQAINKKEYLEEIPMVTYTLEEPIPILKKKVVVEREIHKIITEVIKIEPNETSIIESPIKSEPESETPKISVPIKSNKEPETPKNIMGVEFVPVFPGCEKLTSNEEKRNCMSQKIKKFIVNRFNSSKMEESNAVKEQKVTVHFTINSKGNISNVTARASNKLLEKEAKRVVSRLPSMIPGKQGDKNVAVQYMIPITFKTAF